MKTYKIPFVLHGVAYIEAESEEEARAEMFDGMTDAELIDNSEVKSVDWDEVEEVGEEYYLRKQYEEMK